MNVLVLCVYPEKEEASVNVIKTEEFKRKSNEI